MINKTIVFYGNNIDLTTKLAMEIYSQLESNLKLFTVCQKEREFNNIKNLKLHYHIVVTDSPVKINLDTDLNLYVLSENNQDYYSLINDIFSPPILSVDTVSHDFVFNLVKKE